MRLFTLALAVAARALTDALLGLIAFSIVLPLALALGGALLLLDAAARGMAALTRSSRVPGAEHALHVVLADARRDRALLFHTPELSSVSPGAVMDAPPLARCVW